MNRYLVTDEQVRSAIESAISALDIGPEDDNYIIESPVKVSDNVLFSLAVSRITESVASKIAETEPTENIKQDSYREIDTSEHPFIQLRSNELVEMICSAYQKGKDY